MKQHRARSDSPTSAGLGNLQEQASGAMLLCFSELGWSFGTQARVVLEVALVRATLWQQGDETLAGLSFTRGLASKAANWPVRSLALLRERHMLDWPEWVLSGKVGGSYKSFVKGSWPLPNALG